MKTNHDPILIATFLFLAIFGSSIGAENAAAAPSQVPAGNSALDQALINVARDGRTDKVGKGDVDKIGQLLDQGADAKAKDKDGTSALMWALNFGKDDAAQVLIKHGADAGAEDARGENAAWLAAMGYFCPGALELMIKKGVNVKGLNKKGGTIFSAMTSVVPAVRGRMNYLNDRVWTDAEFQAWQERERRTVDILLAAGVDINGRSGPESKTPLMLASQHGHVEMTRELIAHGADISLKDSNGGETAASLVKMYGHPELLPLLEAKPTSATPGSAPNTTAPAPSPQSHSNGALSNIQTVTEPPKDNALKEFVPPDPLPAQANWTWTTSDGRVYKNVVVKRVEADVVDILHEDGGTMIDIATLPPDIQEKLNYNRALAMSAAKLRQQAENAGYAEAKASDVRVQFLAIDMAESDYQAHRRDIDDAVSKGDHLTLEHLATARVITRSAAPTKFGHGIVHFSGPNNPNLLIECTPTLSEGKISITGNLTINSHRWETNAKGRMLMIKPIPNAKFPLAGTVGPSQLLAIPQEGILEPPAALNPNNKEPRRLFLFISVWPETGSLDSLLNGSPQKAGASAAPPIQSTDAMVPSTPASEAPPPGPYTISGDGMKSTVGYSAGGTPIKADAKLLAMYERRFAKDLSFYKSLLKLTPEQEASVKEAMGVELEGIRNPKPMANPNAKTLDQTMKEILNPEQAKVWQSLADSSPEGMARRMVFDSVCVEVSLASKELHLTDAQKEKMFSALLPIEIDAQKKIGTLHAPMEVSSYFEDVARAKELVVVNILSAEQFTTYMEEVQTGLQMSKAGLQLTNEPPPTLELNKWTPSVKMNYGN